MSHNVSQPEKAVPLTAPYALEFPYKRTTGPVIGAFLTGLRDGHVFGARTADGRTLVPPTEYAPDGSPTRAELVRVADEGSVTTWTWVAAPRLGHPLATPFAFALILLDGADTALLHAVDAGAADAMRTGMRVKARWASVRSGYITDIAYFEPLPGGAA